MIRSQGSSVDPADFSGIDMARRVDEGVHAVLNRFFADQIERAARERMPDDLIRVLRTFVLSGGKRLRPRLCVAGWCAGAGDGNCAAVLQVAASLEVFHAFALIHDDIMDDSLTRRGRPSVHRLFGETATLENHSAASRHGISVGILAGDLALVLADELIHTAGLSAAQLADALTMLDTMRRELMFGQYLDLMSTGRPTADVDHAIRIARYKTAKYTVAWPLRLGARVAHASQDVVNLLHDYAVPVGEAFQLRDDLLDIYGNRDLTGKPLFGDLRQGKHTALAAIALQRAGPAETTFLRACLGNPALSDDDGERVKDLMTALGARQTVEQLIATRRDRALQVLDSTPLPVAVTTFLRDFATIATTRRN